MDLVSFVETAKRALWNRVYKTGLGPEVRKHFGRNPKDNLKKKIYIYIY